MFAFRSGRPEGHLQASLVILRRAKKTLGSSKVRPLQKQMVEMMTSFCVLQTPNRFGLSRAHHRRAGTAHNSPEDVLHQDLGAKMLHLAWHPESNVIATAASNSLYMFAAK